MCHSVSLFYTFSQVNSVSGKLLGFCCLLRIRARAKMIVEDGVCTTGCDERDLCVGVYTLRII